MAGASPRRARAVQGALAVGTSGWAYDWPDFYPGSLPGARRLGFYAERFSTVEVNYSFYHLPRPSTFEQWAAQTPRGFTFALKTSRLITHLKRLADVGEEWERFLGNAAALGPKLGPLLVQLPPSFRADVSRLERFLALTIRLAKKLRLPPLRLAFEPRHPTWFESEAVLATLKRHGAALAFAHSSRYPYPDSEPVTAGFIYLRFHGPRELFASRYGPEGLAPWVPKVRRWLRAGLDVYAFFNNDWYGYAHQDAAMLVALVTGRRRRRPPAAP